MNIPSKDLVNPFDFVRDMKKSLIGFDTLPWDCFPTGRSFTDNYPYDNIYKTEDATVLELALAGFDRSEITIERGDNTLVVSGKKEDKEEDSGKYYTRRKIAARSFTKSYPVSNDFDDIEARFKHGMLTIILKNKELEKETKLIEIK